MIKESTIRDFNPWWSDPKSILKDRQIKEWHESEIKHVPELQHEIAYDFEPSNTVVYSLRGPRQVGKTTLIKLQIKEFLEKNTSPWNILYHTLDMSDTKQDVVDVIETYMRISAKHSKNNRCYIFLDEVTSVRDWQKGIKWLVDGDRLKNCTVMATGSQAINIRNSTELMPGRRGVINDSYDKVLLPMKFSEYATLASQNIRDLIHDNNLFLSQNRKTIFTKLLNLEVDESLDNLQAHQNELNELLNEYMLTGGIPRIIDEKVKTGIIDEHLYMTYLETITGEWNRMTKNETLLKQFCGAIIKSQGSNTSWSNISKNAEVGSPNTASDYADILKDLFALSIIQKYRIDSKIPMIKKEKKIYFRDPYFLHIFNGWMSAKDSFTTSLDYIHEEVNQGRIIEGITADHLIRLAFTLNKKKQTFDYSNHVFYWKDKNKKEVDFVLYDGQDIEVPIEVKYRNKINHRELSGLTSFLDATGTKSGIIVSKLDLEERAEYVIIPASIFLLLI